MTMVFCEVHMETKRLRVGHRIEPIGKDLVVDDSSYMFYTIQSVKKF